MTRLIDLIQLLFAIEIAKLIKRQRLNIDFIDFDFVNFINNQIDNFDKVVVVNINCCKHNSNNETDNLNCLRMIDNY